MEKGFSKTLKLVKKKIIITRSSSSNTQCLSYCLMIYMESMSVKAKRNGESSNNLTEHTNLDRPKELSNSDLKVQNKNNKITTTATIRFALNSRGTQITG